MKKTVQWMVAVSLLTGAGLSGLGCGPKSGQTGSGTPATGGDPGGGGGGGATPAPPDMTPPGENQPGMPGTRPSSIP
jgi:hypothetical protein